MCGKKQMPLMRAAEPGTEKEQGDASRLTRWWSANLTSSCPR